MTAIMTDHLHKSVVLPEEAFIIYSFTEWPKTEGSLKFQSSTLSH